MSELRQDPVSKDWVINAPVRAGRPHSFSPKKGVRNFTPKKKCPFEDCAASGNWPPLLSYPSDKAWRVVLIPNKYPAVVHHQACTNFHHEGPYQTTTAIGHHDLLVTRDHTKGFAEMPEQEALEVFCMLQKRYRVLVADRCLTYASAFLNWGVKAGASLSHPHYQILTLPIIPPNVRGSLDGSLRYYREHRRCVHCAILSYELKQKKRILVRDARSVALTPFVSREPFEVRIFPRRHLSYFERTPRRDLLSVVRTLRFVLRKIKKNLHDPDLNFFIHTAPIKQQSRYGYYHWHIEILPAIAIGAGFELSTGLEINAVDPDQAAVILRK